MKNPILLLFIAVAITIFGCATGKKFEKDLNTASIPPDLTQKGYTLLIIKEEGGVFSGKSNRSMEKNMKKYYPGDFELISEKDLQGDKYTDTDKYRYVIRNNYKNMITLSTTQPYTGPGTGISSHRTYSDQIITDRKENKEYPSTEVKAPGFAGGIKMFAEYISKR